MPKVMKICKTCGKEYEACHTPNPGIFRWRDVACSPECAQKYIHDVMVARGEIEETKVEAPKKAENIQAAVEEPKEIEVNEVAEVAEPEGEKIAVQPSKQNRSKKK